MFENPTNPIVSAIEILRDARQTEVEQLISTISEMDYAAAPSAFASSIVAHTQFTDTEAVTIVTAVLGFLRVAYQSSTPEGADRIDLFLRPYPFEAVRNDVELRDRVGQLLAVKSLRLRAKGSFLDDAHFNKILPSVIITDVRPVFDDNIEDGTHGVMIYHNLKLIYRAATSRHSRTLTLSCDFEDLQALQRQIQRALQKHAAIEAGVQSVGQSVWFPSSQGKHED